MNERPAAGSPSQTDVVIDGLKRLIVDGTLRAGDRLPIEKDLAAQLGVSRGSLREGVRALALLGVLETRQGDGTYVTSLEPGRLLSPVSFLAELPDPDGNAHLLGVRRVLEAESAALAARSVTDEELDEMEAVLAGIDDLIEAPGEVDLDRFIEADSAFHRAIAHASRNPALAALIENLGGRTLRTRLWRAVTEQDAIAATHREHRGVLAELQRRDPERARIRMEMHILAVEEFAATHRDVAAESASTQ